MKPKIIREPAVRNFALQKNCSNELIRYYATKSPKYKGRYARTGYTNYTCVQTGSLASSTPVDWRVPARRDRHRHGFGALSRRHRAGCRSRSRDPGNARADHEHPARKRGPRDSARGSDLHGCYGATRYG